MVQDLHLKIPFEKPILFDRIMVFNLAFGVQEFTACPVESSLLYSSDDLRKYFSVVIDRHSCPQL